MERYNYDLSHYAFSCGTIGGLQTLGVIPVVAGDSLQLSLAGVFRLSPLRRQLVMDTQVQLFAFFVPYRHVYGSDWEDFLKEGVDESVTFSTATTPALTCNYTGFRAQPSTALPLWAPSGYAKIWNEYFRVPTASGDAISETAWLTGTEEVLFGKQCGYLPTIWSTGIDTDITTADYQVTLTADTLDLLELSQLQGRYKSEITRSWFARRYRDVLNSAFGSDVSQNFEIDQRPYLLARNVQWFSGYDVDGTGDANLGTFAGKGAGVCELNMRRKFFEEHGTLWIMALLRFPTVHEQEVHYLTQKAQPTYKEIAGDPSVINAEPPLDMNIDDFFPLGTATSIGELPYAQWYRMQPSSVHSEYSSVDGFAFEDDLPTNKDTARYIPSGSYSDMFAATALRHWQCNAKVMVDARRVVPPGTHSIFAGAG